jgi:hypothetical protein
MRDVKGSGEATGLACDVRRRRNDDQMGLQRRIPACSKYPEYDQRGILRVMIKEKLSRWKKSSPH